jgi:hypothetical protein
MNSILFWNRRFGSVLALQDLKSPEGMTQDVEAQFSQSCHLYCNVELPLNKKPMVVWR